MRWQRPENVAWVRFATAAWRAGATSLESAPRTASSPRGEGDWTRRDGFEPFGVDGAGAARRGGAYGTFSTSSRSIITGSWCKNTKPATTNA